MELIKGYGDAKARQLLSGFTNLSNVIEKGGKLDTGHLVLKEVSVGGKMMHRWVDPHKDDKEYAQHGSQIDFDHKGEKKSGTVGAVLKTGEYHIKGSDGKSYAKHPHQFNSPHSSSEADHVPKDAEKKRPEHFAEEMGDDELSEYVKTGKDGALKKIASTELAKRGVKTDSKSSGAKEPAKTSKPAESKPKVEKNESKEPANGKKLDDKKIKAENSETDSEDINEKFESYENFVQMVADGDAKCGIAYGTGGVGKSHTCFETLKKMKNEDGKPYREYNTNMAKGSDEYDYVKISGKGTTSGIIAAMYEHNGKMLVFDDCDTAITEPNTIMMFKGALDTTGDGTISNLSARPLKTSTGEVIPDTFSFNGRAFFISNLPSNKIDQAIKSRALRVNLTMDKKQTLDRIKHIATDQDGKLLGMELNKVGGAKIDYTHEDMDKAIKFLDTHKEKMDDLNVRTLGMVVRQIVKSRKDGKGDNDWQKHAKNFVLSKSIEESADYFEKSENEEIMEDNVEKAFQEIMDIEEIDPVEKAFQDMIGEEIDPVEKAFEDLLEKGGVGSGRKQIGSTKTKKPVYFMNGTKGGDYKDFKSHEHFQAARLHEKMAAEREGQTGRLHKQFADEHRKIGKELEESEKTAKK